MGADMRLSEIPVGSAEADAISAKVWIVLLEVYAHNNGFLADGIKVYVGDHQIACSHDLLR